MEMKICVMLMVILMMSSLALCFETIIKGKWLQSGRLIIGSDRITNETKNGIVRKEHDEYADYISSYQSDRRAFTGPQLAKDMLRHWNPSVWCDKDSMTLHIQGHSVPNFLVETSVKGPVPLSQLPSHCGFSVKRARRDVTLVAKYDGCNIAQQGDTYVLPLLVSGAAVKMICPVARPLTTVSCSPSAMVVNLSMFPDTVHLKVNGTWQPVYQASTTCGFTLDVKGGLTVNAPYTSNCWQSEGGKMLLFVQYVDGELTLSCPAVQPPATTPLPALSQFPPTSPAPHIPMGYPFYGYVGPWYFNYNQLITLPHGPTTTTTTKTPTTTPVSIVSSSSADQPLRPNFGERFGYPWLPAMHKPYAYDSPSYFYYGQPGMLQNAPTTTATTTKTPTRIVTSTRTGQTLTQNFDARFGYPWLPSMYKPYAYGMPMYSYHGQPGMLPNAPTTTNPATTVAPSSAEQPILYPWLSGKCKSSGYGVPGYFHKGWPGPLVNAPTTTATTTAPAMTVAPSSADQPILYPWLPGRYNPYVPVASPVSGSGVKQHYSMPWVKP